MPVDEVLRELEQELFKISVRKNAARVAALLTDDFREFGSSGRIFTKAEIIAELGDEPPVSISMRDFELTLLTEELALVTYRSTKVQHGVLVGVEAGVVPTESLRSSLWRKGADGWQMVFHQGTTVAARKS